MSQSERCGHETASTGDPCGLPGTFPDGLCWRHTAHQDKVGQRSAHENYTNVRLTNDVHGRLSGVSPDGETLSRTLDRALDALEYIESDESHRLAGAIPRSQPAETDTATDG